jgi:hypothetical protein
LLSLRAYGDHDALVAYRPWLLSLAAVRVVARNNYEIQATWVLRQNQQNQQLTLVKIGN